MSTNAISYKAILGQLTSSQRWHITIVRLFYGALAANFMIHTVLFMYLLPVLVLPIAVWAAARHGEAWHGSQFPNGYMGRTRARLHRLYRHAAITGLGFSVVLGFMDYFATFFGTYLVTVVGICFLSAFFYTKGLLAGWALVVDPADTATTTKDYKELSPVQMPVNVQKVAMWNVVFTCLTFALVFNVFTYKDTVLAADAISASQAADSPESMDSLASAMSGESSDVQSPDQTGQASQEQPSPAPEQSATVAAPPSANVMTAPTATVTAETAVGYPPDDAEAIAAMQEMARQGAEIDPKDPRIDPDSGQLTTATLPLWPGQARPDGYPAYAVSCSIAQNVCSQTNGMGQKLEAPVESLGTAVTVMRNADVLSHRYTCGRGICTDASMHLIGRISPAMLKDHPELAD